MGTSLHPTPGVDLTADRAADVDADGAHVGLVGVADAVVQGDEDAAAGRQQTEDQQQHTQTVEDHGPTAHPPQLREHCGHSQQR